MNAKNLLSVGVVAALASAAAAPTYATNGYFTHGVGTHSKSMAGAGDAMPQMAIDIANNPSTGVLIGDQLDLGLAVFSPRRSYETSASQLNGQFGAFSLNTPGEVESDNEWFPIPYIAKNWKLAEDRALTVAFYGRGGMNTEYTSGTASFDPDGPGPAPVTEFPGVYGGGTTGVNLNQAFFEVSYSFKATENVAIGIAPIFAYQLFSAEGLGSFAPYTRTFAASGGTAFPQNLTNKGSDSSLGYGLKAGVTWRPHDAVSLFAAYQTKMDMEEFSEYRDLFAEQGSFDIPANARVGVSFLATDNFKLHFDVEYIEYSDVSSVGNALGNVIGCPTAGLGGTDIESCLGGDRGFGFGWDDVTVYQFGAEWEPDALDGITLRAGYSYGEQPISDSDAAINILAPATVEEHFTFGICRELSNGDHLSLAFMYAPENEVSGPNFFDPTQDITFAMDQFEIEFAYSFK